MVNNNNNNNNNKKIFGVVLLILEASLLFLLFSTVPGSVLAGIGTPNATVITRLNVGNVYPEVVNVSIEEDAATFDLIANSTRTLTCAAVVVDYNGESDIASVNATFYHTSSTYESADDNNTHYTNSSCDLNLAFGTFNTYTDDAYNLLANCTVQVQYYANPGSWTCNATATDNYSWADDNFDAISISNLLSVGLPDEINYGTVNATAVSQENETNVSNTGNVALNLSLSGYGHTIGDGNAMNCTLGNNGNISIMHEKFNLTTSTPGTIDLSVANINYTNLTDEAIVYDFDLISRTDENVNNAINQTYWRIYVPTGVAGTCTGNIVFGATVANAA